MHPSFWVLRLSCLHESRANVVDNIQNADGGSRPVSDIYSLLDLKKNHLTFLSFGFLALKWRTYHQLHWIIVRIKGVIEEHFVKCKVLVFGYGDFPTGSVTEHLQSISRAAGSGGSTKSYV